MATLRNRKFEREFKFKTSHSGGKGGQHVNKVMTKVELIFNVNKSSILDIQEKVILKDRLAHKLSSKGDLRIVSERFRSQLKNKNIAIDRFYKLLERGLKKPKRRKPTEPTKDSVEKRYKTKHITANKKRTRKKVNLNEVE